MALIIPSVIGRSDETNYSSLSAIDFLDFIEMSIPERETVLHPILPTQGMAMLYAPRGIGKTWVVMSMALAIATGGRTLAGLWHAPTARKVLYIDGEMSSAELQFRYKMLSEYTNQYERDYLKMITPDLQQRAMPNLAHWEGQEALDELIEDRDVLILDSLSTLSFSGRDNEVEGWHPISAWLRELKRKGKSVIIVHHAGKNGLARGSSAKEDHVDTIISLVKPRGIKKEEGVHFIAEIEKKRSFYGDDAKSFEIKLVPTATSVFWELVTKFSGKDQDQDPEVEIINKCLKNGMSLRQIEAETGCSKSKVHRLKKTMSLDQSN